MRSRRSSLARLVLLLSWFFWSSAVVVAAPASMDSVDSVDSVESPEEIALASLAERRESLGLSPGALADVVVSNSHLNRPTETTYVDLQQRLGGIEIVGAVLTAAVSREGQVLGLASRFVPDPGAMVDPEPLALSALQAVTLAAEALELGAPRGLRVLEAEGKADSGLLLTAGGIATAPIAIRLRYQPTPEGRLRLVWELEIDPELGGHWWRVRIDAASGEVLGKIDLLDSSGASAPPRSIEAPHSPPPPLVDARTIVVDPALDGTSAIGWGGHGVDAETHRGDGFDRDDEPPEENPPHPGRMAPSDRLSDHSQRSLRRPAAGKKTTAETWTRRWQWYLL